MRSVPRALFAGPSVPSRRFRDLRNIPFASRLARISIEYEARPAAKSPRLHVPKQRTTANGTLHQRHQDDERPVHPSIAGHLLRRETTREGPAEDGGKSNR